MTIINEEECKMLLTTNAVTPSSDFWDNVGLTPYAQALIEAINDNNAQMRDDPPVELVNSAGYAAEGFAIGEIEGQKVAFFVFLQRTCRQYLYFI